GVGAAAGLADLGDDGCSLFRAAAVMDQHLRACIAEGRRAGAANAARGAGDESGLSCKLFHCRMSFSENCEDAMNWESPAGGARCTLLKDRISEWRSADRDGEADGANAQDGNG